MKGYLRKYRVCSKETTTTQKELECFVRDDGIEILENAVAYLKEN